MPAKIRLTRHGKKDQVYFHLVVADGRAPRDGKFIEKLGVYNPRTNPATIDFDFERALYWIQRGVQPTSTAKTLLSHKGVIYKDHLLRGVAKKALTLEQAEAKFSKWLSDKSASHESKINSLSASRQAAYRKSLEKEALAKEARAGKIAAKVAAAIAAAEVKSEVAEPPASETQSESNTTPA